MPHECLEASWSNTPQSATAHCGRANGHNLSSGICSPGQQIKKTKECLIAEKLPQQDLGRSWRRSDNFEERTMVEAKDLCMKELHCLRDFECCTWQDGPTIQNTRFQAWRSAVDTATIVPRMYHAENQAGEYQYHQQAFRYSCHRKPSSCIEGKKKCKLRYCTTHLGGNTSLPPHIPASCTSERLQLWAPHRSCLVHQKTRA